MTAVRARRIHRRPEWSEKRERHLRVIDGGGQRPVPMPGPGQAVCLGCGWTPEPGTYSGYQAACDHTAETGHATVSRYRA